MTEFAKVKIGFALALLGTLFTLHPLLDRFADGHFLYLGYTLRLWHAHALIEVLLGLSVYFYAVALTSEHFHLGLERTGNYAYALAVLVLPVFGGLYLSALAANRLGTSHFAWAAPAVALGSGILWVVLSQVIALRFRHRLAARDRFAKVEQLARQEVAALANAREMFHGDHYDLAVVEAWRAVEARLLQILVARHLPVRNGRPHAIIDAAIRRGIVTEPTLGVLRGMQAHWNAAVSTDPLTKEAASEAIGAARHILASVPAEVTNKVSHYTL